jgi:ankyrin repeat protein
LLQQVDANETQADGATALAWAVHRNDLESAELLIQAGADVNAPNDHGVTPLSLACANIQNAAMVKKLLEAGGNPNSAQVKGETVLMTCSRTGNAEAIRLLLAHGVEVDAKEPWRWQTALMWAAAKKHANVVALLVEHGADVHAQTRGKFTPLMFAAQQGDVDSARILLTAGADVNQVSPHGSALLVASASSREQTAIFLLEQGADPNVVDVYGNTPLHYAVRQGFSELDGIRYDVNRPRPSNMPVLAQALIASGADVNVRIKEFLKMRDDRPPIDITGATPFFLAAVSVDAPLMKLLADNGADIRMSVNEKTTPLIAAAMGACPGECRGMGKNEQNKEWEAKAFAAVKMAVELGADVNAANDTGQTAMHIAAFTGSDSIIQLLADKGAAVDPVAASGETPWTMAMGISANLGIRGTYGHHKSTVALLLKLGAKVRGREGMDPRGRLALVGNVGAEDGETEVIDPNENQQYP